MPTDGGASGAGVPEGVRLTGRERAVLRLVVERYGNQDIADRLVISKRTVESHVATLLTKFGVPDRRALIEAAGPSSFRAALTETLRTGTDPIEVLTRAAELVGRHLVVHRAYYQEFDRLRGTFTIHRDYCDGVPSVAGTYVLADFSDDPVERALRTGEPMVVRDSAELQPSTAAAWHALSVRAAIAAPTMRDGVCVAGLGVTSAHPRDWTEEDVALLVETAERTWTHVERIRLERELQDSEHRFRALVDSVPALVWQTDATGTAVFASRSFLEHTGFTDHALGDLPWDEVVRFHADGEVSQGVRVVLDRRTEWTGQAAVRRHDGQWQELDARVTPRFDGDGAYLGLLCVCHPPH